MLSIHRITWLLSIRSAPNTEMLNLKKTFKIIESSTAKPITKSHPSVPLSQTQVPALSKQISSWHWCSHVHKQRFLFRGLWKVFRRENCHICLVPLQCVCLEIVNSYHSLFISGTFTVCFQTFLAFDPNTNLQIEKKNGLTYYLLF